MKKDVNDFSEPKTDLFSKRNLIIITFLVLFITLTIYFLFFQVKSCKDTQCFIDSMNNCDKSLFVKQDTNADWVYTILGNGNRDSCIVKIQLLRLKTGSVESEKLEGEDMICDIKKGNNEYPERDLTKCTGKLKEDMQELIIQRMHNYIIEVIGEVKQGFSEI
ncbi:MAG: hypothetical protein WC979_06765 [Candidatus Pacearchaeota archaeon]